MKALSRRLFCFTLLAALPACKVKRKAGETDAEYRDRLKAIYSAQAVLGLSAASDVIQILASGKVFDVTAHRTALTLNEQINIGLDQVRERLRDGLKGEPLDKLKAVLTDFREANRRLSLGLSVAAVGQLDLIFEVTLFALDSLQAVLEEAKQPTRAEVDAKVESLRKSRAIPGYVTDLIELARTVGFDALRISRLTAADAWGKAQTLATELHSKNAARLKELPAQVL